jgi:hypothetical protein
MTLSMIGPSIAGATILIGQGKSSIKCAVFVLDLRRSSTKSWRGDT